ncbi:RsmD family RNA methyltransferase [Nocardioides panaciterrulae]|uniref:Release factor glutamine methyltransferase n=1 Tax=Nocardioides panaciterrulae TaxID=661492 RepID=A0A7Y9E814_9ACTN|nr:RsmD family RNA methyltransferase [Nocardioides panaciterrulae]NYD42672.1 release factor glutamine methyltransferase [Nocardioides panaciterrulae]
MTGLGNSVVARSSGFGDLIIDFDDRVLEPRPWTVAQSRWAAELLRNAPDAPVLELCAGAGQIGLLAISHEPRPLVSVDLNPIACDYTRANAERAGLADLVEVREGAMDAVLAPEERFSLVIADPPWVPSAETGRFPADPLLAIDGGSDGLALARQCWLIADRHLQPGGAALLQIGTAAQARQLARELRGSSRLRVRETRSFARGVLVALTA